MKYRPNDKDARTKYVECSKLVKQQAFERAISVSEDKKSVVDSLNLENMSKQIPCFYTLSLNTMLRIFYAFTSSCHLRHYF